ncbi:MAG: hypothetical protein EGR83_08360 [Bacteroides cellulosilyticus]|nr:hypothetical protein [Bacteroides cellulosilyticus]
MKKKFWSNFFMGILAIGVIVGCSNDELEGNGTIPDASKDAVYMNVQVQLPVAGTGTRSETKPEGGSTDGVEVGKENENKVVRVLLVLADKDNNIISYGLNEEKNLIVSGTTAKSTHKIDKTTLANYYNTKGTDGVLSDNEIKVYVFCNPTKNLINIFGQKSLGTKWVDEMAEITEAPSGACSGNDGNAIWGGEEHKNGFLMSTANSTDIDKKIPKDIKAWDIYTEPTKAFDLSGKNIASDSDGDIDNKGTIKVERSVARFDFKDGSNGNNTYDVVIEKNVPIIQIRLERMGLVNMSKKFFYLRRVSDDGLKKSENNGFELCGTEVTDNYVVDTDADEKIGAMSSFDFGGHFNFCLGHGRGENWTIDGEARTQWYNASILEVIGNPSDEWKNKEYHIWRYVTENTIPKAVDGQVSQRNGISTGIVFKGKMIATEDAEPGLKKAINEATGNSSDDPILYAHGGNLFVSWTEVRKYAINNKEDDPVFYKAVFGTPNKNIPVAEKEGTEGSAIYSDDPDSPDYRWNVWYNEKKHPESGDELKAFKKAATDAQLTLYQSSKDGDEAGYYCYYYYWNRHNDNGNNGVMGAMEFAVVRNNVYKLAVTSIKQLGHPRISENDPDPIDPEDPDESSNVYLTLSVEVLPWVVRVNNIDF